MIPWLCRSPLCLCNCICYRLLRRLGVAKDRKTPMTQLNFHGMDPMLRTATECKEFVRNKLRDFACRQRLRNLKRAYRRERDQKRRQLRREGL